MSPPARQQLKFGEVQGTALAAYLLSVTTLRFLRRKGALEQDEVNMILQNVLSNLEKSEFVSKPAAHVARGLLSALASEMVVPQKPPN